MTLTVTTNGSLFTATDTVNGVSGSAGATLEGVGLTLTYYSGPTATGTPLSGAPTAAGGHAIRDPEQPARDRPAPADRPGPVGEDEEDGLKGVLGIMIVAEAALADPEHDRAVPVDQLLEGGLRDLVAPRDEPFEELRVGDRPDRPVVEQPVNVPEHSV